MKEVLVTIIGIGAKNTGLSKVSVGSKVLLQKEPANQYDSDAIQVFLEDGSESVGYVANRITTIEPNTNTATAIKNSVEDTSYAEIVQTFPRQRNQTGLVAKLLIDESTKQKNVQTGREIKMSNEYRVLLIGSVSIYPNKFKVADEFKKGLSPMVKLVNNGDKILAYFNGGLCGYVDAKKQDGVSSFDEVKDLFEGEKVAKIETLARQNYIAVFSVAENEASTNLTLKDSIERVLSNGILTQGEIDKRIAYCKANEVTAKQMAYMFNSMKKYDDEIAKRIPSPKTLYQDTSGLVKKSIAYMNVKRNQLFEGDRGVGKNVLTETIAWLYNRPLYEFSMNSQHDNNSLLGGKTFADATEETKEESLTFFKSVSNVFKKGFGLKNLFSSSKEEDALEVMSVFKKIISYFTGNKKLKYDPEIIVQAAEAGGILVMDEFNTGFGHVNSLFNSLLDDRRSLHVPGYKTIKADENFMAIATQNRDYTGTFENNEATIDRFVPIIFPTLTTIEPVLIAKIPGISLDIVTRCQTVFAGIKNAVEKGEMSDKTISIRGFIDACLVTEQEIPLKDALIDNIANRATEKDERETIMEMIKKTCG